MTATVKPSLPALDGIRALACMMALLAHTPEIGLLDDSPGCGGYGVCLFYTLSGFLLTYHYLPGELSLRYWAAFIVRRFFRIYPAFAIALLLLRLCDALQIPIPLFEHFDNERLLGYLLLQPNISTYWSIIVEIKFYALFPLLGLALLYLPLKLLHKLFLLIVCWGASLTSEVLIPNHDKLSLLAQMDFFAAGIVAATFMQVFPHRMQLQRTWNILLGMCLIAAIPLIFIPRLVIFSSPLLAVLRENGTLSPLMGLLVLSAAHASGPLGWLFTNRVARFTGIISYSLYVTHRIIFGLAHTYLSPFSLLTSMIIFLGTFVIAWVFYRLIEKPFNRIGKIYAAKLYYPHE